MAIFMDIIVTVDVATTWKWASTERQQSVNRASTERQQSVKERQQSVNDFRFASCILQGMCDGIYSWSKHWPPVWAIWLLSILLHLNLSVDRASTECQQSVNRVSTEHQQCVNRASTERQQTVNRASTEHQHSVNRALMIFGAESCIMQGLYYGFYT